MNKPLAALYSYEVFKAKLTDGPRDSYLDETGERWYVGLPAGSCQFHFAFFCKEIEFHFDQRLRKE